MVRIHQDSGYFHSGNIQKAKALRKRILTPLDRLSIGLQAFYSGNLKVFQTPIRDYLIDLPQHLTESQRAFEELIHLPSRNYQSYRKAQVEAKFISFYSNLFLNRFVEALKSNTGEVFLNSNEKEAKDVIDFVMDEFTAKLETIVNFIKGDQS